MSWKDEREPTIKYCLGGQVDVVKSSSEYRALDTIDGEPMEFEWNISQVSPHCSLATKSKSSCQKWAYNQKISQDGLSSCRCSTTSHRDLKKKKQECESSAQLVSIYAKRFSPGRWSFLGPGSEEKWYSTLECKPQGEWTELQSWWFLHSAKANTQSSDPQVHRLEECSRAKSGGKLSIHFCAVEGTIETVFRTIISVNQLSIYGTVSDLCDECKACHVRTRRLVSVGQSDPLFVPTSSLMKTHTPFTNDPAQEDLLQKIPRTRGKATTTKSCD